MNTSLNNCGVPFHHDLRKVTLPSASCYPSQAFPGLSGKIMNCLTHSGIAAELVGTQLIAFLSLLTQGVADVTWPNGVKVHVGANSLVVAPSGTGKSMVFKLLREPIEQYLSDLNAESDSGTQRYFFIEDATRAAIVQSLHCWPVAVLLAEEAGQLTGLIKDGATLAKLLDGSSLYCARVSTGRVELFGHRFSMLLLEQPEIFEATKARLGANKGGVGFINRFFVAQVNGAATGKSNHQVALTANVQYAYAARIEALLDTTILHIDNKIKNHPALRLSADAAQFLIKIGDDVRKISAPGAPLFFISEYIARHEERVLRLAGAFHVFEYGANGEISLDTIQRAAILGEWHINAFAQMIYVAPKPTQAESDAMKLEQAINQIFQVTRKTMFRQSEMRADAINLGLTPARFNRALAMLCDMGKLYVRTYNKVAWVEINANKYLFTNRW